MIISPTIQLTHCLMFFTAGLILGTISILIKLSFLIKKNNLLFIICDISFAIISFFLFWTLVNIINLGEFRLYFLLSYIIGFVIQKITLRKLFAKIIQKVYTLSINVIKTLKDSKLGRFLLK